MREHLSGNYCRCTGYQAIVDAVEATARARAGQA
ncbi:MAG TPA: 2Fe-2S iron-sulfur cluster-binding protein [Acetobacteraceae bacterium]|nr:2Fe-2S iron-sulfur cluster-binding protein [Acetobacteraceae bacterium]